MSTPIKRKLATILSADVAGYSRLMEADEEGTLRLLAAHRAIIDAVIDLHDGRVVNTAGDSVLAEFTSLVQAVRAAIEIQDALRTRNEALPESRRMLFRIGVNIGDVMLKGDDLLGDGVNIAARLQTLAEPGGLCISGSVFDQIEGKLSLRFQDIGEQALKNIARPIRAYRVRATLTHPAASAPGSPLSRNAGEGAERQRREAGEGSSALPLPDKPSIAVLPFANMSGDPEQEYFADGMVEEIITALSRIRWLFDDYRGSPRSPYSKSP